MNCMEVSPCLGWLNSNQTMREATTERAHELDAVYEKIVETQASTFKNFQYIYFKPEWKAMFAQFAEDYGAENLPHLIEASDGFHPSQTGNAMFAQEFFNFLEKNHPDAIGPINPFNEEISQMFFSA
jgi:acyloxyacyl hydrolase